MIVVTMDLSDLSQLLTRAIALLDAQMTQLEAGEEQVSEEWQRFFGKDHVVAVLAKLVAMQKQLNEQLQKQPSTNEDLSEPLSQAEWEMLEICVRRWREAQDDQISKP